MRDREKQNLFALIDLCQGPEQVAIVQALAMLLEGLPTPLLEFVKGWFDSYVLSRATREQVVKDDES